jgi:hypothetical protein
MMWGWSYRLSKTLMAVITAYALGLIGSFVVMVMLYLVFQHSAPDRMRIISSHL